MICEYSSECLKLVQRTQLSCSAYFQQVMLICLIFFRAWMIKLQKPKSKPLAGRIFWRRLRNGNMQSGEEIWLDEYEMVNRFIGSILWIGLGPCLLFNARVVDGFF